MYLRTYSAVAAFLDNCVEELIVVLSAVYILWLKYKFCVGQGTDDFVQHYFVNKMKESFYPVLPFSFFFKGG